jgi:hypothetical protein
VTSSGDSGTGDAADIGHGDADASDASEDSQETDAGADEHSGDAGEDAPAD